MAAGTKITFDSGATIAGVDETSATLTVRGAATGASQTQARRGSPVIGEKPGGGTLKIVTGSITFDTSYNAGGEDITEIWKQFKPNARDNSRNPTGWELYGIVLDESVANGLGKGCVVDYANKKLKVVTAFAGTEAVAATDQSAVSCRFLAWGAGS